MDRLVNYSSEDDREDSPKANAAERCASNASNPNKRARRNSGQRYREEDSRSGGGSNGRHQTGTSATSYYRDKDMMHGNFRKSDYRDSNRGNSRYTNNKEYYSTDRRQDRFYDKKRDFKDDRKRRDRDYEHKDVERDRRDRFDRHRQDRHDKSNSHRDKDRRKRYSESPTPTNKESKSTFNRNRNRSRSRSPSKEYQSHNKDKVNPTNTTEGSASSEENQKATQKDDTLSSPQFKASSFQPVVSPPLNEALSPKKPNNNPNHTTVTFPTYYNPNIINPTKYAEQVQKRKLIWGAKKTEDTTAKWGHATFSEDTDGKVASKFMRLMGIKSTPKPIVESTVEPPVDEKKCSDVKSRQAMFTNMEQQYEVARQVTHTMRGVGLGFGSQSRQY